MAFRRNFRRNFRQNREIDLDQAANYLKDVVSMKQYLKEYIAEIKEIKSYIDEAIRKLEKGETLPTYTIIDEIGFDASTITQEDIDKYGL